MRWAIARTVPAVTMRSMQYPSDLTDDLRAVVDAMLYLAQIGCQWRYLPESLGPWTRAWSQFRRRSRNGDRAELDMSGHAMPY